MNTVWQDLRYGTRMLLKKPGFTVIAVITLALGIGANSAIFSVVYAVLLRPLPYHKPDNLVMLGRVRISDPIQFQYPFPLPAHYPTAPALYLDWRERQKVFEDLGAYEDAAISPYARFYLSGDDGPERLWGARITVNLCALLGVKAALGRTFLPEEEEP